MLQGLGVGARLRSGFGARGLGRVLTVDDVHEHGREDRGREQVAVREGVGALEVLRGELSLVRVGLGG